MASQAQHDPTKKKKFCKLVDFYITLNYVDKTLKFASDFFGIINLNFWFETEHSKQKEKLKTD